MKISIPKTAAILLALFAFVTLFMSSAVIFDLFDIREKQGHYVLFIVIANFMCAFLYLISAYGLFFRKEWATRVLMLALVILAISFAGLLWHIHIGSLYEVKTVKAMLFRMSITAVLAILSWKYTSKDRSLINLMK